MPSRSSRLAWLDPLDTDEATLSPPYWRDLVTSDSIKTYSSIALAVISLAVLLLGSGLGRPAVLAMVAIAYSLAAGLVLGGLAMASKAWRIGKAKTNTDSC